MTKSLQQFGELNIKVYEAPDEDKGHVVVHLNVNNGKNYKALSLTAAFLTHVIAQKSNLGYEKALEVLTDEAMKYKMVSVEIN